MKKTLGKFMIFGCLLNGSNGFSSELSAPEGLVELKDVPSSQLEDKIPKGEVDDDNWSDYLHDKCDRKAYSSRIEEAYGVAESPYICRDWTPSYRQPPSRGFRGWEGRCGQTAGSNILYGLCTVPLGPEKKMNDYMRDLSPGVFPTTLKHGLNEAFEDFQRSCDFRGQWKWYYNTNKSSFIQSMKFFTRTPLQGHRRILRKNFLGQMVKRTPVALLIRSPGSHMLHWITLVDVEEPSGKCVAVVNHYDNQYKTPCSKIAKWSKGVSESYPFVFKPYNIIAVDD